MNAMALVGMSGAASGDEDRERLLDVIAAEGMKEVRRFTDGTTLVCEMRSNIATAR